MRKLACSLVSLLAAALLVAACGGSDDNPGDLGPGSENPPIFDGGDASPGWEGIQPLDGTPDGVPPTECDKTTLGNYAFYKSCAADTDCAAGEQCDTTVGFCLKACTADADCTGGQVCITDPTTGTGVCDACGKVNQVLTLGEDEDGSMWGICTCPCTPDDPTSPLSNEDTCPDLSANMCSDPLAITAGTCTTDADCADVGTGFICQDGKCQGDKAYCVHKCQPSLGSNACNGKLACMYDTTFGVYDTPICVRRGCKDNNGCMATTGVMCDPKKGLGTDQPNPDCGPGTCLLFDYQNETCTSDADCAAKWPNYVCVDLGAAGAPAKYCVYKDGLCGKPGKCDVPSGLCDKKPAGLFNPAAKIGDPCKGDTDCGDAMDCMIEMDMAAFGYKKTGQPCTDDGECCSFSCENNACGAGMGCVLMRRNGYCSIGGCDLASTLTIKACPAGSECNTMWVGGGYCQKTCSLADASSCRGNAADFLGDYECYAWNNFTLASGGTLTKAPVCEFNQHYLGCDVYSDIWKTDCSFIGDSNGNPTNMKCRGYDGQPLANQKDPAGICLDDTSSGTQVRNPLP